MGQANISYYEQMRSDWLTQREIFEPELLETLASLPRQDLEEFAHSHFNEAEAKLLIWQALITKAHRSPADYAEVASKGVFKRNALTDLINDIFVEACFSQKFVIISSSVRSGKSYLVSQWAPAWYLCRFPNREIILAAHSKKLAGTMSSKVRDNISDTSEDFFGEMLDSGNKSKEEFKMEGHRDGGLHSLGVGGGAIGLGGHMIIVDDVYRNAKDAYSPLHNREVREWHTGTIRHRLNGGGSMIVILARWKQDDYAGWLLDQAKQNHEMENWIEIKIPQIAGVGDPLGRKPGECLVPERMPMEEVMRVRASVGERIWACQFQQEPISVETALFDTGAWQHIPRIDAEQDLGAVVLYWDLSAGGARSDYVAGILMGANSLGQIFILDVFHQKFTSENADLEIRDYVKTKSKQVYAKYKRAKIYFEQTPGAGNAVANDYMRTVFQGLPAESHKKSSRDKIAMAAPFSFQQKSGNVYIATHKYYDQEEEKWREDAFDWYPDYIEEFEVFGDEKYNDDQVDATSGAYEKIAEMIDSGLKHTLTVVQPKDVARPKKTRTAAGTYQSELLDRSTIAKQVLNHEPRRQTRSGRVYRARRRNP